MQNLIKLRTRVEGTSLCVIYGQSSDTMDDYEQKIINLLGCAKDVLQYRANNILNLNQ